MMFLFRYVEHNLNHNWVVFTQLNFLPSAHVNFVIYLHCCCKLHAKYRKETPLFAQKIKKVILQPSYLNLNRKCAVVAISLFAQTVILQIIPSVLLRHIQIL